jgi:ATP-dependent exoDNAse (exonuclease V) beta subunit
MSELDEDLRSRELSIDPARSILLQAPAGSGKTTVLTQRLLSLLSVVDEPEQILAITFTRKAAAEMRSRVIRALSVAASGNGEADALSLRLARAVLDRSHALRWGLLEQPGRLRIQTIDSFNFWLASQLPIASRAGTQLAVAAAGGLRSRRPGHAAGRRCRSGTRR